MNITINAHQAMNGRTHGCIYTRESNGADPACCYTYSFADGVLTMIIWIGNDQIA